MEFMKSDHKDVFISGGKSRIDGARENEWNRFESARLLQLDLSSLTCQVVLEYRSPPELCPSQGQSHVFKAGHRDDEFLYLCTQTEILIVNSLTFEIQRNLSLPSFNDLHHVRPDGLGNLLVVSTGLDMVTRVSLSGEILNEWSVYDGPVWKRHDRDTDFRKVLTTKPHPSHPNYVFLSNGEVWATRHFQKDAICLENENGRVAIDIEKPHDGNVRDGKIFFTTVDGHIVKVDQRTGETLDVFDLRKIFRSPRPLGFCRGLHVLSDNQFIVGFSRLRGTSFQRNISWVKDQIKQASRLGDRQNLTPLKTRIALVNTEHQTVEWEIDLEPYDLHAVFSVF